jgi:hypothetical protein
MVINVLPVFNISVAIMAGIAQVPEINGHNTFPDNPNLRIILSIKKTTRPYSHFL